MGLSLHSEHAARRPRRRALMRLLLALGGGRRHARIVQSRGGAGVVLKLTHAPTLLLFR